MEQKRLLGLYGGTFDPPHRAHVALAKAFTDAFPEAELLIMPCLIPPHKVREAGAAEGEDRLAMARLAFGELERTGVSDYELRSEGTSYTYLTVKHLKEQYPQRRLCLIMGQDNLAIMEKWREYRYLLANCSLAVAVRGDEPISGDVERLREAYGADIHLLNMEKDEVSSTTVRRIIREGGNPEEYLKGTVLDYIRSHRLYGSATEEDKAMQSLLARIYAQINCLSPKRRRHTYGVEKAAFMLAKNHYPWLDRRLVAAAALLHDCTKEYSEEEQLITAERFAVYFNELELEAPKLRHAVTGAAVARVAFGLPEEAANAILYHTTAKADMTPLEKILYLADFTDENRSDELCVAVRRRYYEYFAADRGTAVDRTLLYALERSIEILTEECKKIHPHTIEARNFLKESLADEDNKRRADSQ